MTLSLEWLSAFTPLGILSDGEWIPIGAGVLFHDGDVIWLLTADHVLRDAGNRNVAALVSAEKGGAEVLDLTAVYQSHGVDWIRDAKHDLAAGLMPTSPDLDIKAVGEELCLALEEVVPSMACFTVGCPYGVRGFDPTRATPLVLDGVIAGINAERREIYISTPTFPGNSGGPILVVRNPYDPGGSLVVGRPTVLLAGIVRDVAVVRDANGELPPLHLGIGIEMSAAIRLVRSARAKKQREKVSSSA